MAHRNSFKLLLVILISTNFLVSCSSSRYTDLSISDTYPNDRISKNSNNKITPPQADTSLQADIVVRTLLAKMSLEEKVGQMVQAEIKHITPAEVTKYSIGSVLNGGGSHPNGNKYASVNEWRSLANEYYQASIATPKKRTRIPILWGTDAVHGHSNVYGATIFPHNIGLGAANNPELTQEITRATAKEVRYTGINWAFAPTVAVARDDRWGRTYESYSEDPNIVATHSKQAVLGLQGQSLEPSNSDLTVLATAKHFIGDGGTSEGIDQGNTIITKREMLDIHGKGFKAALEAGAQTVMASFNSWNGKKIHGHKAAINALLKQEMQFNGFVIGDWNAHGQLDDCSNSSCPSAFNAGIDMLMAPKDWKALIKNTINQVNAGEIPISRIDDAVSRILRVKYHAGLFKPDYNPLPDKDLNFLGSYEHRNIARKAVRESLVLLKNNNNTLPLLSNNRILVVGDAADNIAQQSGGWTLSWQGDGNSNTDFPGANSILDGIRSKLSNTNGTVTYDPSGEMPPQYIAENYDVVIAVYGEQPYAESSGDRKNLMMPSTERMWLKKMANYRRHDVPVISILVTGRALSTNEFINLSNAFIVAWLPGSQGEGIADVLITNNLSDPQYDFTGKLPFSWPLSSQQNNINNYPSYLEQPQFTVGYGLNYTDSRTLAKLPINDKPEPLLLSSNGSLPIMLRNIIQPWELYVGDEENWNIAIKGNKGSTQNNKTVVVTASDHSTQEDARNIRWNSNEYGQAYFQYSETVDISKLAENNGNLRFKIKVEQPPTNPVAIRMDCMYPCSGTVDVTQMFNSLPHNKWQSVSIDLECFAKSGTNFSQINTPFLIGTKGKMSIAISDIVIDQKSDAHKQISCRQAVSQSY